MLWDISRIPRSEHTHFSFFTFSAINPTGVHFKALFPSFCPPQISCSALSAFALLHAGSWELERTSRNLFLFFFQHQWGGKGKQSPPPPDPSALGCTLMSDSGTCGAGGDIKRKPGFCIQSSYNTEGNSWTLGVRPVLLVAVTVK